MFVLNKWASRLLPPSALLPREHDLRQRRCRQGDDIIRAHSGKPIEISSLIAAIHQQKHQAWWCLFTVTHGNFYFFLNCHTCDELLTLTFNWTFFLCCWQNLLRSGTCPEIQGFLQVKEPGKKTWKKVYYFLRRSGLYCSTKGSSKVRVQNLRVLARTLSGSHTLSLLVVHFNLNVFLCVGPQEPRHLQYVADLEDLNVYTVVNGRKLYGAPADFTFCIKVSSWCVWQWWRTRRSTCRFMSQSS